MAYSTPFTLKITARNEFSNQPTLPSGWLRIKSRTTGRLDAVGHATSEATEERIARCTGFRYEALLFLGDCRVFQSAHRHNRVLNLRKLTPGEQHCRASPGVWWDRQAIQVEGARAPSNYGCSFFVMFGISGVGTSLGFRALSALFTDLVPQTGLHSLVQAQQEYLL